MKNISVALIMVLLVGCGTLGTMVGGKVTSYEGNYLLQSKGSMIESKEKLISVLESVGWNKSKDEGNTINFDNQSSIGATTLVGTISEGSVVAFVSKSKIDLTIKQEGNFNYGTEESVKKTFTTIQSKYTSE